MIAITLNLKLPTLNILWNGVVATSSPGVTAGNSFYRQPKPFKNAIFFKSL